MESVASCSENVHSVDQIENSFSVHENSKLGEVCISEHRFLEGCYWSGEMLGEMAATDGLVTFSSLVDLWICVLIMHISCR